MITDLETDILECEVKRALESITTNKASGGDGIPLELFQIPERWCCESAALSMPANLENSAVATGLEKVSLHSNPKEKQCQRMLKLHKIALISHASTEKAMATHSSTLAWKIPWMAEPVRLQSMGSWRVRHLVSNLTFIFHFHALEKEMATHSNVLAWRIPGTAEPGGLPSVVSSLSSSTC